MKKEKGVALIIVIFGIMLLAVLGWTLVSLQSGDFDFNLRNLESERALFLAEAGIHEAMVLLKNSDASFDNDADIITRTLNYGQYRLTRSTVGSATEVIATGCIPTVANPRATRVVKVAVAAAVWSNAVGGANIFDWSEMTTGWLFSSRIRGNVTAKYFEGDGDPAYNELGVDYDVPPNALPPPNSGYDRTVGTITMPEIDMDYYKNKAIGSNHYIYSPYIYLASADKGLTALNNNITNPTSVGSLNTAGRVYDIQGFVVYGGNYYTCLVDTQSGREFKMIRINDPPTSPTVADYCNIGNTPYGVFAQLNNNYAPTYAFVAAGPDGFQVVDISNPANPSLVRTLSLGGGIAYGVYARAIYAFVACGSAGLKIINISNPGNPSLLWTYNTSGTSRGVYVRGRFAYVADGDQGLNIVNISIAPLFFSPSSRATVATGGTCYNVYLRGNYAYVACGTAGLKVIDISNINNDFFTPTVVATYATSPDDATDVQISGDYAYVSCSTSGNKGKVKIVNIIDPTAPALSGEYIDTASNSNGLAVYLRGDRYFDGNWNNEKIWYTTGNFMIGGGNFQKTSFVSEGDTELPGLSGIVMRAHVLASANENFPNLATKNGSIVSEGILGITKDFDGLVFTEKGSIIFNGISGCAAIGYNVFLSDICDITYSGKYVGSPPDGIVAGVGISEWREE
ncbi:MAG: hypothetical protein KKG43_04710 [Candidatus Omnitrophica bacterium]|nr:hypothetical protein [Candidatus Omnitrophota bacterium]MBU2035150.1 hypothetical protein [Candidatus Omnitrophota bacterium]